MTENPLNLDWLTPRLAVGGSLDTALAARLAEVENIHAIIDMRLEACDDADELRRHGIAHLHLPTADHHAVAQPMLKAGVDFVHIHHARGERVLIHCEHGIGRAPSLALCVLVAGGLSPIEALTLAKDKRPVVSPSRAQYEAWAEWLSMWKTARPATWEVPDFDSFARVAYRHLAAA